MNRSSPAWCGGQHFHEAGCLPLLKRFNKASLCEGIENTAIISTSRKHKKHETTHFNEYKKGNTSTKKEEKETRDNLKLRLVFLLISYIEPRK